MENWLVLGGGILLIACLYPPILGVVFGVACVMLLTIVIGKIIGA